MSAVQMDKTEFKLFSEIDRVTKELYGEKRMGDLTKPAMNTVRAEPLCPHVWQDAGDVWACSLCGITRVNQINQSSPSADLREAHPDLGKDRSNESLRRPDRQSGGDPTGVNMTDLIPIPTSILKFSESVETTLSMTVYTITGPEAEVRKRVEELFDRWHPLGYGTRVVLLSPERTIVSRYNHCD